MSSLFGIFRHRSYSAELVTSRLFNERGFYQAFIHDLKRCTSEAIIESPFLTNRRVRLLLPDLQKLRRRGVRLVINTRHPQEYEGYLGAEAESALSTLHALDAEIYFTGGHHRKIAILDRRVLWEGSLNILSQNDSCEVMRRIMSYQLAKEMTEFIGLSSTDSKP